MATVNSFGTRTPLAVDGRGAQIYSLPALASRPDSRGRAAAVLDEDPAREPAAPRGRPLREGGRHRSAGPLGRQGRTRRRKSRSRRPACCCRTSPACRRRRSGGDARRHRRARRRSESASTRCSRSSSSSTTRCRSTTSGRPNAFQLNAELEFSRNKERYAFLRWGQNAFQQFPRRAARYRHRPPGQSRIPGARRHLDGADGGDARRIPTRWSAPTRTRRWSTGSAWWDGASAASRPRRRCSVSRSRC